MNADPHPSEFPVHPHGRPAHAPRSVPWAMLAPHEDWAQWNHSQSLARLAERGGLSLCEMAAILEDRKHRTMDQIEALAVVLAHVEQHSRKVSG